MSDQPPKMTLAAMHGFMAELQYDARPPADDPDALTVIAFSKRERDRLAAIKTFLGRLLPHASALHKLLGTVELEGGRGDKKGTT